MDSFPIQATKTFVVGSLGMLKWCRSRTTPIKFLTRSYWKHFGKVTIPTTLNRQGDDVGPQYRSIILYHNEAQKRIAEEAIQKLNAAKIFRTPIVTEVVPLTTFYVAEDKHQDFYRANKGMRYCRAVIEPKVKKIRKLFAEQLRSSDPNVSGN